MSEFRISIQEVKNKVGELRELNTQLKNSIQSLGETESSLIQMWEGDAKTAFHNAFTQDKGQMDNFYNLIEIYAQRLEMIVAQYLTSEQQNIEIANQRTYK